MHALFCFACLLVSFVILGLICITAHADRDNAQRIKLISVTIYSLVKLMDDSSIDQSD